MAKTPIIKTPLMIKVRGERTFAFTLSAEHMKEIALAHFRDIYDAEANSFSLEVVWENNGDITIHGHQDLAES